MVAVDVRHHLIEPVFALVVGGPAGHHAERVDVLLVAGRFYSRDVIGIGREHVAALGGGETERLARGREGDAVADDRLVAERGKRRVLVALGHEVVMDLVREHDHAAAQADFTHRREVLTRPAVAGRVLRIAQDQRVRVVADAALEVFEIHLIAAVD